MATRKTQSFTPLMMQSSIAQIVVIVLVLIIALESICRLIRSKRQRKGLPLPPGPTQIPLLGNAHTVGREPWATYTNWHAKYGDVLYLRLLDQDVVVLGSQQVAVELLEKRSQIYSDRPFIPTVKPFGGDYNFAFTPYGDHWRFCRRIFQQTFRSEAAIGFRPMQLRRARQLVVSIANDPDRYSSHYCTFSTAAAVSAAYDYEPSPQNDPIVKTLEDLMAAAVPSVTEKNAILLKLFPFLLHVPDWFPGSSLKRAAKCSCDLSKKVMEMSYHYAEEKAKASHERPIFCMVSDHLSRMQALDEPHRAEYIATLKKTAISSVFASEETTSSTLKVFTLAMVLHPHAWRHAQEEIDLVVGTDRLPDFGDRSTLPYVEAIIRETVRWSPVIPLGVWHATSGSDVYNGYYIPKGATVVANTWAMSRDEGLFPNAEAFIPERFVDKDGMLNDINPMEFTFGFGRRRCPGRFAADASLWSAISTMLATLDFNPARDDQGKEIHFEPKWLGGFTRRPEAFPCRISLRAHVNKSRLECILTD